MYRDDPCIEPYNNFIKGNSFTLIIPEDLRYRKISKYDTYHGKDGEIIDRDLVDYSAQSIAENLKNHWSNICSYDVSLTEGNFTDFKSIFLKVKTK